MRDGLITLIFVDWLPPYTDTSRGFLYSRGGGRSLAGALHNVVEDSASNRGCAALLIRAIRFNNLFDSPLAKSHQASRGA